MRIAAIGIGFIFLLPGLFGQDGSNRVVPSVRVAIILPDDYDDAETSVQPLSFGAVTVARQTYLLERIFSQAVNDSRLTVNKNRNSLVNSPNAERSVLIKPLFVNNQKELVLALLQLKQHQLLKNLPPPTNWKSLLSVREFGRFGNFDDQPIIAVVDMSRCSPENGDYLGEYNTEATYLTILTSCPPLDTNVLNNDHGSESAPSSQNDTTGRETTTQQQQVVLDLLDDDGDVDAGNIVFDNLSPSVVASLIAKMSEQFRWRSFHFLMTAHWNSYDRFYDSVTAILKTKQLLLEKNSAGSYDSDDDTYNKLGISRSYFCSNLLSNSNLCNRKFFMATLLSHHATAIFVMLDPHEDLVLFIDAISEISKSNGFLGNEKADDTLEMLLRRKAIFIVPTNGFIDLDTVNLLRERAPPGLMLILMKNPIDNVILRPWRNNPMNNDTRSKDKGVSSIVFYNKVRLLTKAIDETVTQGKKLVISPVPKVRQQAGGEIEKVLPTPVGQTLTGNQTTAKYRINARVTVSDQVFDSIDSLPLGKLLCDTAYFYTDSNATVQFDENCVRIRMALRIYSVTARLADDSQLDTFSDSRMVLSVDNEFGHADPYHLRDDRANFTDQSANLLLPVFDFLRASTLLNLDVPRGLGIWLGEQAMPPVEDLCWRPPPINIGGKSFQSHRKSRANHQEWRKVFCSNDQGSTDFLVIIEASVGSVIATLAVVATALALVITGKRRKRRRYEAFMAEVVAHFNEIRLVHDETVDSESGVTSEGFVASTTKLQVSSIAAIAAGGSSKGVTMDGEGDHVAKYPSRTSTNETNHADNSTHSASAVSPLGFVGPNIPALIIDDADELKGKSRPKKAPEMPKYKKRASKRIKSPKLNKNKDSENDLLRSNNSRPPTGLLLRAKFRSQDAFVTLLKKSTCTLDNTIISELREHRQLHHVNINQFLAVTTEPYRICILQDYCSKGTLASVLSRKKIQLDRLFKLSFASDVAAGMLYLHQSSVGSHGRLTSSNILVDSRWFCKIANIPLPNFEASDDAASIPSSLASPAVPRHEHISMKISLPKNSSSSLPSESVRATEARFIGREKANSTTHHPRQADSFAGPGVFEEAHTPLSQNLAEKFWTAPELLRSETVPVRGTQKGDIYSFGIILYEIITRKKPFESLSSAWSNEEIIVKLIDGEYPAFRPHIGIISHDLIDLAEICRMCWDEVSSFRPDFVSINKMLYKGNRGKETNLIDEMMAMMENYANNLESEVIARTGELDNERRRSEELLSKMLPRSVVEELKAGRIVHPETYESVTIAFLDVVGFTKMASESSPIEIVEFLNDMYSAFDTIIDWFDVYKVETIGDSYMVASGLPKRNGNRHAYEIATMSLEIMSCVATFVIRHRPGKQLQLRCGMHSGSVVAGIIGLKMPRYCLFGDTVNYASRMESSCLALRIHVSPECKRLLDQLGGFRLDKRGYVNMKGKGAIETYHLVGKEGFNKLLPDLRLAASIEEHEFK